MFDICIDAYFSCEFIILNFLHMFVLPDVASSGIASVGIVTHHIFILDVPC